MTAICFYINKLALQSSLSLSKSCWKILDGCELRLTVPLHREEEVSSCQDQMGEFRRAAGALTKWLEQTGEKVPAVQPNSSVKSLERDLQIVSVSRNVD